MRHSILLLNNIFCCITVYGQTVKIHYLCRQKSQCFCFKGFIGLYMSCSAKRCQSIWARVFCKNSPQPFANPSKQLCGWWAVFCQNKNSLYYSPFLFVVIYVIQNISDFVTDANCGVLKDMLIKKYHKAPNIPIYFNISKYLGETAVERVYNKKGYRCIKLYNRYRQHCKETAKMFKISKSTVHKDCTKKATK